MDTAHPDELLLGLDALDAETLEQCIAVDVDCALPQLTNILSQYDSAGELVRHAIDFGYVWAEQGQGKPTGWRNGRQCWSWRTATGWTGLWISQNLHCYEFILAAQASPNTAWSWHKRKAYSDRIRCSTSALTLWLTPSIIWRSLACLPQTTAMSPGMGRNSTMSTVSRSMDRQ